MSKYLKMFDKLLNKTIGDYVVRPVLNKTGNVAKQVYYVYKPRQRIVNKERNKNIQKLKTYYRYLNAGSLARSREMLSIIKMNKTPCRIGRKQVDGTCWFQSVINGWLLSDRARIYLRKRLEAYKKFKNTLPVSLKACPKRILDPDLFFSYVDEHLKGNANKNQTKYKNVNLIKNLSMEQNNTRKGLMGGGVTKNVEIFLDNIFKNNWGRGKDIIVKNKIEPEPGYALSHCSIHLWADDGKPGHAVTGYTCNGKRIVYDSNTDRYLNIDWAMKTGQETLKKYYELFYMGEKRINIPRTKNNLRKMIEHYRNPVKKNVKVHCELLSIIYLRITPKFINQPYMTPKLNKNLLSNERLKHFTGISNRRTAKEYLKIKNQKHKITQFTNFSILQNVYRRKFKRDPPEITNRTTLYHQIMGTPYNGNGNLNFEYNLRNKYSENQLDKFLIKRFGRTNDKLSLNDKRMIVRNFYHNTPYYDEASLNTWKKVYRLKHGKNAPRNLNTNKKIYNQI